MKKPERRVVDLVAVRQAVADYISTEGCSCCQSPRHDDHKAALAKLLKVRPYSDGSGHNFSPYETKSRGRR